MSSLVGALHESTTPVGDLQGTLTLKSKCIPFNSKWKKTWITYLGLWPLMRSSIYNQVRFQKIRCGYNRFPPLPLHFLIDSLVQVWICLVVDIFVGSSLIVKTELISSRWRLHMLIRISSKAQKISSVHSPQARYYPRIMIRANIPNSYYLFVLWSFIPNSHIRTYSCH